MIIETAKLTIDPTKANAFETAVAGGASLFRTAKGCRAMRLEREIETPANYLLRVEWESIEDHMVHFRQSDAFQVWRSAAGPFFVAPPEVVHHQVVRIGF